MPGKDAEIDPNWRFARFIPLWADWENRVPSLSAIAFAFRPLIDKGVK